MQAHEDPWAACGRHLLSIVCTLSIPQSVHCYDLQIVFIYGCVILLAPSCAAEEQGRERWPPRCGAV